FYSTPAADMPATTTGNVPGGTTWLNPAPTMPEVENVRLIGVDGTVGQISRKGGYVVFDAAVQGQYIIEIESTAATPTFEKRTLTGTSDAGPNRVFWDGKAGDGADLPATNVPVKVSVQ